MTVNQLTYFNVVANYFDVEAPQTSGSTSTPTFSVISGFVTFTPRVAPGTVINVANLDLAEQVAPLAGFNVAISATGGTLAANPYTWAITATNANGESTPAASVSKSTTGSTSSAVLTWTQDPGATGYKIYRTQGVSTVLVTTINSGSTVTYTDTGSAGTSASPPASNTAEMSGNTSLALAAIQARIYEGILSTIDTTDTPGVQLVANSSVLDMNQLIYDVSFSNVVYADNAMTLSNFAFQAPATATTIDLSDPTLTRLPYNPSGY